MDQSFSAGAIANRIRSLIAGTDRASIEAAARELDVSELALRMSIDELAPHPTIEVMLAVIAHFGVDPSWLLTGSYDSGSHRTALGDDRERSRLDIAQFVARRMTPPSNDKGPSELEA